MPSLVRVQGGPGGGLRVGAEVLRARAPCGVCRVVAAVALAKASRAAKIRQRCLSRRGPAAWAARRPRGRLPQEGRHSARRAGRCSAAERFRTMHPSCHADR